MSTPKQRQQTLDRWFVKPAEKPIRAGIPASKVEQRDAEKMQVENLSSVNQVELERARLANAEDVSLNSVPSKQQHQQDRIPNMSVAESARVVGGVNGGEKAPPETPPEPRRDLPCRNKDYWKAVKDLLAAPASFSSIESLAQCISTILQLRNERDSADLVILCQYLERFPNVYRVNNNQEMGTLALVQKIAGLASEMEQLFPHGYIPLLVQRQDQAVTLSSKQTACLLANAFFCTIHHLPFPMRNNYQEFHFLPMFASNSSRRNSHNGNGNNTKFEKLHCLFSFFYQRLCLPVSELDDLNITFHRKSISPEHLPDWEKSSIRFENIQLEVMPVGTIEDDSPHFTQLDFANQYLGGGVLRLGCVQEEILFMICPELLITLLLVECLQDNECVFVKGARRYSCYSGYASAFTFDGIYSTQMELELGKDTHGRLEREILAIDALMFPRETSLSLLQQLDRRGLCRELNKAFVGFSGSQQTLLTHSQGIATGNWGCGAFNGNVQLKAILQLMAAAESSQNVRYFTFNDNRFYSPGVDVDMDGNHPLHALMETVLQKRGMTVGQMYSRLCAYNAYLLSNFALLQQLGGGGSTVLDLFAFLNLQEE